MGKFTPKPPPMPPAPPPVPTSEDPEVKAKKAATKKAARNRMGFGQTDLTQGMGDTADTKRPTLG